MPASARDVREWRVHRAGVIVVVGLGMATIAFVGQSVTTRRFHDKKNTGRTMTRRTNTNGSWLPMTGWRATGTPTGQLNQL